MLKSDCTLLKFNPQFSKLLKNANDRWFQTLYALLTGRVITPSVSQKRRGILFNGTTNQLNKITPSMSVESRKPGIFMTKQKCKSIQGWCDPENASYFDTIVIEYDNCHLLDEQLMRFNQIGMPKTALIYSGGKSLHALIILAKPVPLPHFRKIVADVARIFPQADQGVLHDLNGFCRFPINSTHWFQPLIEFNGPVENAVFEKWLADAVPTRGSSSGSASYLEDESLTNKMDELEARILTKVREMLAKAKSA